MFTNLTVWYAVALVDWNGYHLGVIEATPLEIEQARRKEALKAAYSQFTKDLHKRVKKARGKERKLIGAAIFDMQGSKRGR